MHNDDRLRGWIFTRREALKLLAASGTWALTGYSFRSESAVRTGTCVVRPELTEGPYFVDNELQRSDIRSDPSDGSVAPGVPLQLTVNLARLDSSACVPLAGARVNVWHCDARGLYSGVRDPHFDTAGKKFLRGYQVTDADGKVSFTTIYPGWYPGRAVHVHFKVRSTAGARSMHELTSQWFFDESLTDEVHSRPPYAAQGRRRTLNERDGIFRDGGSQLILAVVPVASGYAATFDIAFQTG